MNWYKLLPIAQFVIFLIVTLQNVTAVKKSWHRKKLSKSEKCQIHGSPWFYNDFHEMCCPCIRCANPAFPQAPWKENSIQDCVNFYEKDSHGYEVRLCGTYSEKNCCSIEDVLIKRCTIPQIDTAPKTITKDESMLIISTTTPILTTAATTIITKNPAIISKLPFLLGIVQSSTKINDDYTNTKVYDNNSSQIVVTILLIVGLIVLGGIAIFLGYLYHKKIHSIKKNTIYRKGFNMTNYTSFASSIDAKHAREADGQSSTESSSVQSASIMSSRSDKICSEMPESHQTRNLPKEQTTLNSASNPEYFAENSENWRRNHQNQRHNFCREGNAAKNEGTNNGWMVSGSIGTVVVNYTSTHPYNLPILPAATEVSPTNIRSAAQHFTSSELGHELTAKLPTRPLPKNIDVVPLRKPFISRNDHPESMVQKLPQTCKINFGTRSMASRARDSYSSEVLPERFNSDETAVKVPQSTTAITFLSSATRPSSITRYSVPVEEESQDDGSFDLDSSCNRK